MISQLHVSEINQPYPGLRYNLHSCALISLSLSFFVISSPFRLPPPPSPSLPPPLPPLFLLLLGLQPDF